METKLFFGLVSLASAALTAPANSAAAQHAGLYSTKDRIAAYWIPREPDQLHWSKNVAGFLHRGTGMFCITPAISVDQSSFFPQVSMDISESGTLGYAYWVNTNTRNDCAAGDLEVMTVSTSGLTDSIAWDLTL
jgi:hypothetical protein